MIFKVSECKTDGLCGLIKVRHQKIIKMLPDLISVSFSWDIKMILSVFGVHNTKVCLMVRT